MTRQLSLLEQQRLRHPEASDAEHVERWAADLIKELELEPPIDLDVVASYLGVAEIEADDLDVAGCLFCHREKVVIKVRRGDSVPRRRFTVCHECSHTFFPGYARQPQYRCNPGSNDPRDPSLERLCDVGASELLLPRVPFQRVLREHGFGLDALEDISSDFEASLEATGHRMVNLSPGPALLIVMEFANKPTDAGNPGAEPKLRVRSHHAKGNWPFLPRHKSVSEGTPLHRALKGEIVHEIGDIEDLTRTPLGKVDLHARLYPYWRGDNRVHRVLALVRPASSSQSGR